MEVTFPADSSSGAVQCINISIIDDDTFEGNETFDVILTLSDANVRLGNDLSTITITDDDRG